MMAQDTIAVDLIIESTAGGSVRHVLDLYDTLTARGHDIRLIVSMLRADSVFLERIRSIDPSRILWLDMHRNPHPSDIVVMHRLRNWLKHSPAPRLLHAHSTKAGLIASMVRAHTAGTLFTPHAYRGMDPELGGISRVLLGYAENAISRFHDCVIAVSQTEMDYARSIGLDTGKVVYIPNGVDVGDIRSKAEAARKPRGSNAPVIGFVGRMTYQKNPGLFLETFRQIRAQHPDARALMCGDGPLLEEMRARVRTQGLEDCVEVPGHVETLERILDMDIMVHTSLYESLPYSLLEGCSVGLPVVSVRNAGSVAILGDSPDITGDLHDATALADRCLALIGSNDRFEASRARSLAAAEQFSIDTMTTSIESRYRVLQESFVNTRMPVPQTA